MGISTFRGALPPGLHPTPQSVKQIFYYTFVQIWCGFDRASSL